MKKLLLVSLLLYVGVAQSLMAQNKASKQGNVLSASDIHFNPYYDTTLVAKLIKAPYRQWKAIFQSSAITQPNSYKSDSNYPLFVSALAAMKKQNSSPDFMVITGDFLCHSFQKNFKANAVSYPDSLIPFTSKTIQFVAMMLNQYFPKTTILPVLGNNDSYCGDYMVEAGGPFLSMFAKAFVPLQRNHSRIADEAFIKQFAKGGYYTFNLGDGSGGKMVMLNTVFFSGSYKSCGAPSYAPADTELTWLSKVLKQSKLKHSKVWLAAHIPPGINVYSSMNGKKTCAQNAQLMMNDSCNTAYIKLLKKYAGNIKASFAGHTHMDDFRVLYDEAGTPVSFIHITPAVSPLFGNNPGFQCLSYSKATFGLLNSKTYYYNLNQITSPWALEYDFQKAYGVKAINAKSMDKVRNEIAASPAHLAKYINFYDVSNPALNGVNQSTWKGYWCGTGKETTAGFVDRYCGTPAK